MINKEGQRIKVGNQPVTQNFEEAAIDWVSSKLDTFSRHRLKREETWLECWGVYLGTPEARQELKQRALRHVGNVNNDWRHDVNTGKAFEQVETIVAYLQQAFFPNRDWFDAVPEHAGYADLAAVIKNFTAKKLKEANFLSHWEMFLRQLCITGVSVLAMPWRKEVKPVRKKIRDNYNQIKEISKDKVIYNNNDFEVLDVFDIFFDYTSFSADTSPIIRRLLKDKAEIAEKVSSGYYSGLNLMEVYQLEPYSSVSDRDNAQTNKEAVKRFQGLEVQDEHSWQDKVQIYEYWGDITVNNYCYKDHLVVFCKDKLLRFEPNPFAYGKPFVIGTYTPIVRSPVALGVIEPSLGMLHEFDIITNQRLDNLELSVDTMWEYANDGTLQPEDIYSKPGKVFVTAEPGRLNPIDSGKSFTISYDEANVLEQRIDKNAGTGNLISANAARNGERVTAAEIQATRDAGGNRLSAVHKHIEETALLPLLDKVYRSYQQFITDDEVVRIPDENIPDAYNYVAIGLEELNSEFKLTPVGADHVADKEYEVQQLMTFLQIVSGNEQMSQAVDYYNIMFELARKMGLDDINRYLKKQEQQPALEASMGQQSMMQQPMPEDPTAVPPLDQMAQQAIEGEMQIDGGQQLAKGMLGMDIDPIALQQQLAQKGVY